MFFFFQVYDEWSGWYAVLWFVAGSWWCRSSADSFLRRFYWYDGGWRRCSFERSGPWRRGAFSLWYLFGAFARSRQRSLGCSLFANPFKVAKYGRDRPIELFAKHLNDDVSLRSSIWILSGLRLLCHCGPLQSCHADVFITALAHDFPGAYDRHDTSASVPPTSAQLNYLAALREEPDSSEGSSADEEAKASGAGWPGTGKPMQIGVGYTVRDFCDGQSLATPGRWPPVTRQYPCSDTWTSVSELVRKFSEHYGTTQLLMDLALGRVEKCLPPKRVSERTQRRDHRTSIITGIELEQSEW